MCRQTHMKNKKKAILLISSMLLSALTLGMVGFHSFSFQASLASELPSSLDCNYYFNEENGYTSIYEMNDVLFSDVSKTYTEYKTWGTVTCHFTNSGNDTYYIQSRDKYGNSAALALYKYSGTLPIGSVVTVSGGTFKSFNYLPEIESPSSVEIDYSSNPSPVETLVTNFDFWNTSSMSTQDKNALYRKGPIQVSVNNMVYHNTPSSTNTYLKFKSTDSMRVQCFYGGSSDQNAIRAQFENLYSSNKVSVTGYVNYYKGTTLELLVRSPTDVVGHTVPVTSIDVAPVSNIYYQDVESAYLFNVTAHYEDGSSKEVTTGVTLESFSTAKPGKTTATLSYTENNVTVYGSCEVTILDNETSITYSDDLIDHYYVNEPFIKPAVTAHSYYGDSDVTDIATFSTTDTSTGGVFACEIDYENTKGDTLNTSYYYWVYDVYKLTIENFSTSYEVGDPISSYSATAQYVNSDEADVTNRTSLIVEGFDTSTPGTKEATFKYGNKSVYIEYTVNGDIEIDRIDLEGNYKIYYSVGEAFDSPLVYAYYTDGTYADVTSQASFTGFDSSTTGVKEITVTYGEYVINYDVTITESSHLYEYDVSIDIEKSYNTGSYGASGDFEYYRAVKQSGYICKLISLTQQSGCEPTLGGALYNVNPIKDIDRITLTYSTSGSGSRTPKFTYGENSYDDGYKNIPLSSSTKQTTFDLSAYDINYLKFDSGDYTLYIQTLTIYYSGDNTPNGSSFVNGVTGNNEYRIAPTVYSGNLIDGVSYIDVPTSFDIDHLTVTSTKRYTYYSYEYVSNNPQYISAATITDPVDVCNYFQAFGCAPANYGASGTISLRDGKYVPSVSEVNSLFGSDARCISKYSRTTGYATSVPYYGSKPTYYELDIDTNGQYSTSSRQVGRIVAWATGFNGSDYGYGSQCVCTYTDDHYSTFKEYNNYGGFLSRFKDSFKVVGCVRGNPTTLSY